MLSSYQSQQQNVYDVRWAVTVPPSELPVTLADVKSWLHKTTENEDALLTSLISAATDLAETYLGRALVTRTLMGFLDADQIGYIGADDTYFSTFFYAWAPVIQLPMFPGLAVTNVSTYGPDGVGVTVDPLTYSVLKESQDHAMRVTPNGVNTQINGWYNSFNGRQLNSISVTWTAGYGAAAAVPQAIKTGILMAINALYTNRGDCSDGSACGCTGADKVLGPYRVMKL